MDTCVYVNLFIVHVFFNRYSTDVTDICMDENAVSSDPVVSFLLDEVVVKDWCKRTFGNIVMELQEICILETFEILLLTETNCVPCIFSIWVVYLNMYCQIILRQQK